jgi:hypothetical protein
MTRARIIPRAGTDLLILFLIFLPLVGCGGGILFPSVDRRTREDSKAATGLPFSSKDKKVVLIDLHQKGGWTGYALLRSDNYSICSACLPQGPEATWELAQNVVDPAVGERSARFDIGGNEAFSDVVWNNHLIGDLSSQDLHDRDKLLVPSLRNFVYDVHFFGSNLALSQALEFDINQFFDGKSFVWGHKCRIAGGREWDTWDNTKKKWIASGIACRPKTNEWNHLVVEVQRTDDDRLLFQSITLNGKRSVINRYDAPTTGKGWYGITINYQQDGNGAQAPYSVWLDKLTLTSW